MVVRYAFEAASAAGHLTLGDELILHALGVEWSREACEGQQRGGAPYAEQIFGVGSVAPGCLW